MSGGLFVGVEKYLIGGITDATKGLMMSYSSMMMGLAAASATIYIMWRGYQTLAGKLSTLHGRHDVGHHEDGDHPVLCG